MSDLMVWPAGPSTPAEAPPWLDDKRERDEATDLRCIPCGDEFRPGQSCRCSEPVAS